ncbi:MAG: phenylalanine--tRNA ligase subunit beta [Alphaproteobacteria bacterium]|nr:phenylalanine--tRNA ligase subunit beta [Alphaproteobacteria bacterium]
MKFTLSWLKDHLETDADLETITEALTALGLEVEGVVDRAKELSAFTVAHVQEAMPHPDADRLRVCKVETKDGLVQVVCGAPNARTGMKGVFAPAGSYVPGTDLWLKKGVIRGQESNGMLVSEREMGLSDEHDGIIELPEDAPVGEPFAKVAGYDDPIIEIAITPNRADCTSVYGVARDLAAAGIGTLKPLDTAPVAGSFDSPIKWNRAVAETDPEACPAIVGRYFRNVKNGPSPKWMQDRLKAIGLRPISALVDITNYVMMDAGRPLHAYDADKVTGDIVIRFAELGESYMALNGKEYSFDETMIVIGDDHGVDDLAGIMGGERTGCSGETVNMFLEVAIFDPLRVAATGRKLNVLSDARYRFERGLDQLSPWWGAELATKLILELCGGEASHLVVAGEEPNWKRSYPLRLHRTLELGGVDVPAAEQRRILETLGFEIAENEPGLWSVTPPPWRGDIVGEADLVEEVLRVNGFGHIPATSLPPVGAVPPAPLTAPQRRIPMAKRLLAHRGMMEAVTFSFMDGRIAPDFGGGQDDLKLVNPIASDLDTMRPSILPNLLTAAAQNAHRGYGDIALFEVGPAYANATPKGQSTVAAGIRVGKTGHKDWAGSSRPVDAFDAKADALAVIEAVEGPAGNAQVSTDAASWYHPGRSGCLRLGPNVMAMFGEVHPAILEKLDLRGPAVAFEVILDKVPMPKAKATQRPMLQLSHFQPVTRDFAFVVDDAIAAEQITRAAAGGDKKLVTNVTVFDVFQGGALGDGKKSVAIQVTLQPTDKTLTDEDLEAVAKKIVGNVEKQTGGVLRA